MKRRRFLLGSGALVVGGAAAAFYWPLRWTHIVVHHSAGNFGTIEFLQEVHRERQAGDPIDAIPYHYVIGNGNGLAMGEVASDWREEYSLWGAHVSGNNSWQNAFGIGICLVGNFEEADVPDGQFHALVTLTRALMREFDIVPANVGFHGKIEGESTKCPGSKFPYARFEQAIARV